MVRQETDETSLTYTSSTVIEPGEHLGLAKAEAEDRSRMARTGGYIADWTSWARTCVDV